MKISGSGKKGPDTAGSATLMNLLAESISLRITIPNIDSGPKTGPKEINLIKHTKINIWTLPYHRYLIIRYLQYRYGTYRYTRNWLKWNKCRYLVTCAYGTYLPVFKGPQTQNRFSFRIWIRKNNFKTHQ